jgi:hypothetical protein
MKGAGVVEALKWLARGYRELKLGYRYRVENPDLKFDS